MAKDAAQARKDIELCQNKYLKNVVGDIEILFYIYSGRIMQDCYYGRGLFIKPDFDSKNVFFVSPYNSSVDALYNMSSGQLVALVIAFVMTLNKLYSTIPVLTIDDPIQTIDDINMWGLMETIRHEFHDYFLTFSTHEQKYGSFLRYKFGKFDMKAAYFDMGAFKEVSQETNF